MCGSEVPLPCQLALEQPAESRDDDNNKLTVKDKENLDATVLPEPKPVWCLGIQQ